MKHRISFKIRKKMSKLMKEQNAFSKQLPTKADRDEQVRKLE